MSENGLTGKARANIGMLIPCQDFVLSLQNINERGDKMQSYKGKTLQEWANELGVSVNVLYARIKRGWTMERVIATPKVKNGTHNLKYDIVGQTFKDRFGNEYIVEKFSHRENSISYYQVRFLESGYTTTACSSHIRGVGGTHVFDRLHPTFAGVGMFGYAKQSDNPKLFVIWSNMIDRCYNPQNHAYKNYGEVGVTVCERWKRFDYFLKDVENLPGYDKEKVENGQLNIDKDIINRSKMTYSPETCCFVTRSENSTDANIRRWNKIRCNDYPFKE